MEGVNGWTYTPGNSDDLANKITKAYEKRDKLREMGYRFENQQMKLDSYIKTERKESNKSKENYNHFSKEELIMKIYQKIITQSKKTKKSHRYLPLEFDFKDEFFIIHLIAIKSKVPDVIFQDTITGRKFELNKKTKEFMWKILQCIENL